MDYKISIIRYLYYISFLGLLILYLFPGSLIGYFFYGDFTQQPNMIPNPLGTSINHVLAFFYFSILGLIACIETIKFKQTLIFIIGLAIILELFHLIIPNRSFQFIDLLSNLLGTFLAIVIVFFYRRYKNGKF